MQFPVAVPTVSFVVLKCRESLFEEDVSRAVQNSLFRRAVVQPQVYVVRFRTKHNGGIGVPGGRLEFQSEDPIELFEREGGEELGLKLERWMAVPFTTRCKAGRDVRAKISPKKYTHGNVELPEEIARINEHQFAAHHCVDLVYLAIGISADPATLVPYDTVEVAEIQLLDLTKPLPELPISDDTKLLEVVGDWVQGKIDTPPIFLHG